jgi:hypothetical protein
MQGPDPVEHLLGKVTGPEPFVELADQLQPAERQ